MIYIIAGLLIWLIIKPISNRWSDDMTNDPDWIKEYESNNGKDEIY